MFIIALTGFLLSALLLIGLFTHKYVELNHGILYLPHLRTHADARARQLKMLCLLALSHAEKLPQDTLILIRFSVHIGAMLLARLARSIETGAHHLADRVSHKHQFERGESHSEFLKSVREHKRNLFDGVEKRE
jgi:hypothetical protein